MWQKPRTRTWGNPACGPYQTVEHGPRNGHGESSDSLPAVQHREKQSIHDRTRRGVTTGLALRRARGRRTKTEIERPACGRSQSNTLEKALATRQAGGRCEEQVKKGPCGPPMAFAIHLQITGLSIQSATLADSSSVKSLRCDRAARPAKREVWDDMKAVLRLLGGWVPRRG